jgi:hypothetical protein
MTALEFAWAVRTFHIGEPSQQWWATGIMDYWVSGIEIPQARGVGPGLRGDERTIRMRIPASPLDVDVWGVGL